MATALRQKEQSEIRLDIDRVAGSLGAEVLGIKLSGDLSSTLANALWAALCRHKVLFFRNQNHLTDSEHERFASLFGDIANHPTVPPLMGTKHITELDSRRGEKANMWHTDSTYAPEPARASILRAIIVPEVGGDTMWANCVAAYESLDPEIKALADKLRAIHNNAYDYADEAKRGNEAIGGGKNHSFHTAQLESEHPLVHVHPETGERSLLAGGFLRFFVGLSPTDSHHLRQIFQDAILKPKHIVRWRWRAGDVAIWDNRATQHYGVADYGDEQRVLRRVTVAGDVPVSLDGRRSVAIRAPGLAANA